jgi:hypothetical protein
MASAHTTTGADLERSLWKASIKLSVTTNSCPSRIMIRVSSVSPQVYEIAIYGQWLSNDTGNSSHLMMDVISGRMQRRRISLRLGSKS